MKSWLVAIGVVSTVLLAGFAVASPADRETQAAANAMVHRFVDSWNGADGAAYGENYWPDAELVNPVGKVDTGRTAIVQEHVDLWAGPFAGSHIAGKVRRIQRLGPNFMVVDVDLELSGVKQAPAGGPQGTNGLLRNHLKHIMERRNGVWKVLSAQNTFIAPE